MEFEKLGLGNGLGTTEKKNPSSRQGRHRIWGLRIAFQHSKRSAKLPHKGMMHWDQCCFCYCLTIFGSIYVENILHSTYFCHQTLSRHLSSQEILERPPESQWKTLLGRRRVQRFYDQQQNLHSRLPHHVVHSWVSLSNLGTDCLYKATVRQTDSSSVQHAAIWVRKTTMIIMKITEFDKQQLINNYWTLNEYQSTPLILAPSMKRITLELDK